MTINISKCIIMNLFEENASLLFDPQRIAQQLGTIPPLGAVTFSAERTDPSQNLGDLAVACGKEAISLLNVTHGKACQEWLFISDGPWKPATRITLHQKLWKNHRDLITSNGNGRKSDEVAIEAGEQVRYAGLLEVRDELIEKAIEVARVCPACAIIFSSRPEITTSGSILNIFSHAFPKYDGIEQTSIDWATLAIALCPQGDLLMRVSGLFDDREAAVDVIATPQNLSRFLLIDSDI